MQLHLNTYGTYLHVKDKLFEIKITENDVTKKHHVAAHKVKSIWVALGIAISSDAVKLAIQNNIDIVFLDWNGSPLGRVWHSKLGSTTLIRRKQLEFSLGNEAVQYIKTWISKKVGNQLSFIKDLKKHRKQHQLFLDDKILRISKLQKTILDIEADNVDEIAEQLRGWEGTAGRLYFETLAYVLPKQYQFQGRSFRPAADSFNAFLNYAYGVLYSRIEKVLILAGIDPFIGFLHRDDYNYKSMVYDFIEPYRIFADVTVFRLFSAKKVKKEHTDIITNGQRLNKAGKELLMNAFNDYLEGAKVRYKGRNQTRANILQFDAHQLANELIKKDLNLLSDTKKDDQ